MKTSFLFMIIAFALLNNNACAQEKNSYSIQPYQAGTVYLETGKPIQVFLNDNVQEILANSNLEASYYIVFTPVNNASVPSVSNKNNISFTVLSKSTDDSKAGQFFTLDYIVFVKKKMQHISPDKVNKGSTIKQ